MKKQILLTFGLLMMLTIVTVVPSYGANYEPFNTVTSGDILCWKVLNYNEFSNTVDPADWWRTDIVFQGEYVLNIGDTIKFTIDNPSVGNGTLQIGNLTISSVSREDIGFNLNLITGPAWFPQNYSFNPGFVASTNWDNQIDLATNASNERGATFFVKTAYEFFFNLNRSVITFNYMDPGFGQITIASFDNETGVLLYLYTKFGAFTLEMTITQPSGSGIPSFNAVYVFLILTGLVAILYFRSKTKLGSLRR